MKKNQILRVYVYIFMGIGILMMSIGFYGAGQNLYKRALLSKYPLGQQETRCDYYDLSPVPMMLDGESQVNVEETKAQNEKRARDCKESLNEEREIKKITDLYNSIILFVIGAVLFGSHLWVNLKSNAKK